MTSPAARSGEPMHIPAATSARAVPYLQLNFRFALCIALAFCWVGFSLYLALPWIGDLADMISLPAALFLIFGIAIFPGYLNAFLVASLFFDRERDVSPPISKRAIRWPSITLIIAAYNEADVIDETLNFALDSDYPGRLRIIVADDGSEDGTASVVQPYVQRSTSRRKVSVMREPHRDKSGALNAALGRVRTEIFATIDADTLLARQSLRRAVARLLASPKEMTSVAGAVMVRNPRGAAITSLQEWDYQLGIASIKRSQALWQSTLVSQGSFSVYYTDAVRDAGGWPDAIGEDIVLTWAMLNQGHTSGFEPTALAFTQAPATFRRFFRQRVRWARGMIEGLRAYGRELLGKRHKARHGIIINLFFPWMDLAYSLAFIPGVVLACFGNFAIVGPWTLLVVPMNLLLSLFLLHIQRRVFSEVDLRIRWNPLGLLFYWIMYQPMVSPIAFYGYVVELFKRPRIW